MTLNSSTEPLVLHSARIQGFASIPAIAARFDLDVDDATEVLLDAQARGWVQHAAFADLDGWSLTESGKQENERQLASELVRAGCGDEVRVLYREFLPLNARLQRACTDWQLRPGTDDRLAANDHSDSRWDDAVLNELADLDRALTPLAGRLGSLLTRFQGYHSRFSVALRQARAGEAGWVDGTSVDSCHRVWFELHEDLIATLGLDRYAGA